MDKLKTLNTAMIVAATADGEIGYKNRLPWKLRGDLKRFKDLTMGKVLIYGRKTYESLPAPLAGRLSIVLSKDPAFCSEIYNPQAGVWTASSMEDALITAADLSPDGGTIFFIGGASIYEECMTFVDRVYLTLVHKPAPKYDTQIKNFRFPDSEWVRTHKQDVFEEDALRPEFTVPSHSYIDYERIEVDHDVKVGQHLTFDDFPDEKYPVLRSFHYATILKTFITLTGDANGVPYIEFKDWLTQQGYVKKED